MESLWTDIINSEWHDWRGSGRSEDRLDRSGWLCTVLDSQSVDLPLPESPEDWDDLKRLRSSLRRMAEHLAAGGSLTDADIAACNVWLAGGTVIRRLEQHGGGLDLGLKAYQPGFAHLMAEIVASFAAAIASGNGSRIRVCENPDCRWVFLDDTRNRSKRYCENAMCANLLKVRRFRARQKKPEGTP